MYVVTVYWLTDLQYTVHMNNYKMVSSFRRNVLPPCAEKKTFLKLVGGYKTLEATDCV
jgi:hypothetical protein